MPLLQFACNWTIACCGPKALLIVLVPTAQDMIREPLGHSTVLLKFWLTFGTGKDQSVSAVWQHAHAAKLSSSRMSVHISCSHSVFGALSNMSRQWRLLQVPERVGVWLNKVSVTASATSRRLRWSPEGRPMQQGRYSQPMTPDTWQTTCNHHNSICLFL